jgi:hypothetical protein
MFAQMLQIFGFVGLYLALIVLAATGHVAWALIIGALQTTHFVGDYYKTTLSRGEYPLTLAGYNISPNLNPGPFLLHVGGMLLIAGLLFALSGHPQWASALGGIGLPLLVTGIVGSIIYDPSRRASW